MINYAGDIDVSGSVKASNGDRAVFSGDVGVNLSLTYDPSGSGAGSETLTGTLSATVYYSNGGSNRYTLPFGPLTGELEVKQGVVTITPSTVVSVGGITVTLSGSGTVTDNLEEITETITAMGSGAYDGVSFTETVNALGTLTAAPPSQNTKVVSGYIASGYTLQSIYGHMDILSGGVGGAGLRLDTSASVANYGTVKCSGAGSGIILDGGGSVKNGSASVVGTISGPVGVLFVGGAGSLTNAGVILGSSVGVAADPGAAVTIVNDGTIEGANFGVALKATGDRLIAGAYSTIVGKVVAVGGTLELHSSARSLQGTIAGLGGIGTVSGAASMTFVGFGTYALDSGYIYGSRSDWIMVGVDRLAAGKTLTLDGYLKVGDSFGNAGTLAGPGLVVDLFGADSLENSAGGVILGQVLAGGGSPATFENFGAVTATVGDSIIFGTSEDCLVVEAGSKVVGLAYGGGGILKLAGVGGTISGVGATGTLSGAASATFTDFGTVIVEAGASWTATGVVSPTLTSFGSLTISRTLSASDLSIAGGICTLTAGASLVNTYVQLSAGQFVIEGPQVYTAGWGQSGGTLTIPTGSTLNLPRAPDLSGAIVGGGALAITGYTQFGSLSEFTVASVRVSGSAALLFVDSPLSYAGTWTQTGGLVNLGTSGVLTFKGAGDVFNRAAFVGDGAIAFVGGADTLENVTFPSMDGSPYGPRVTIANAAVTLAGSIWADTTISATTANLTIATAGARLTGRGSLLLSDQATNRITGATSTATLINVDDTISGAGRLGAGNMRLVNDRGALIEGDQTLALNISTGQSTIANAGWIEAAGAGGVVVWSAIANTGVLYANGGVLTLEGAVTGAGHAVINNGALVARAAFTEAVTFDPAGGQLTLVQSQSYTGRISGFSLTGATSLDLRDIGFVGAGEATFKGTSHGGVLTVSDGTHTARIGLIGDYVGATFTASNDHEGGVVVVASTTSQMSTQTFVAAMAAFAGPTGSTVHSDAAGAGQSVLLAPPPG